MADMPDLSHLTAEERAIIEGVLMRQKQEEEQENEIMRWVDILFYAFAFRCHCVVCCVRCFKRFMNQRVPNQDDMSSSWTKLIQ